MIDYNIKKINEICKKYSLKSFALFGSAVTDSFTEQSDVDVLISFDTSHDINYFDSYFDLKSELETYWHRSVDLVVEKKFRNSFFREAVENQKMVIYEQ